MRPIGLITLGLAVAGGPAPAQCVEADIRRLEIPDPHEHRSVGWDVAMSGQWVALAAVRDDLHGEYSGAVHMYRIVGDDIVPHSVLRPADAQPAGWFGICVALDGTTLAIADTHKDTAGVNDGSVSVYEFDGVNWSLRQRLVPEIHSTNEGFGGAYRLGLDGDTMVVGAPVSDRSLNGAGEPAGAAYVFRRDAAGVWRLETVLAPDELDVEGFGLSVDVSGDNLVIGAPGFHNSEFEGLAFVFHRHDVVGWAQEARLEAPEALQSRFGFSVDCFNNDLAVGAPTYVVNGSCSIGAVRMYRRHPDRGWEERATLRSPEQVRGLSLGTDVSLQRDSVVAGIFDGRPPTALHFVRDAGQWRLNGFIPCPPGADTYSFGAAVAHEGTVALLGSDADEVVADDGGAAFRVDLSCLPRSCVVDLDHNGLVNVDDVEAFVVAFLGKDQLADIDRNGFIDLDDVEYLRIEFVIHQQCPCSID